MAADLKFGKKLVRTFSRIVLDGSGRQWTVKITKPLNSLAIPIFTGLVWTSLDRT
jgi:hypothetical protein